MQVGTDGETKDGMETQKKSLNKQPSPETYEGRIYSNFQNFSHAKINRIG